MSTQPNGQLKLSVNGQKLIQHFEKCELVAYKKLPKEPWTIGWGNTFYEDGTPVRRGDRITRERADRLFVLIVPMMEADVRRLITRPLLQHQFDALVSFRYNAGTGYQNSKKKFVLYNIWQNVNAGLAGDAMFKYWTTLAITSSGIKLNGLIRRRKSEVALYQTGVLKYYLS